MKKYLFIILILIFESFIFAEESIEKLCKENDFSITYVNFRDSFIGLLSNTNGVFELNSGISFNRFDVIDTQFYEDFVELIIVDTYFILEGIPSYRMYGEPTFYKEIITLDQIKNIIGFEKNDKKSIRLKFSFIEIKKYCSALIICDNLRIRENPNINPTTEVIGKLRKWDKVTIIDSSENIDTIDGLKSCWYKIRTEEGTEGWIFGGFAKIYFTEDDLELLYKAFEKEGSEYTNQFPTPDNS